MYDFINITKVVNSGTGIAERVFIALTDWFVQDGIKTPGPWVEYGDEVRIKETHEFKPGYGFIEFALAPEKNSYNAKNIGDTGFQKFANEVKAIMPGSYDTLHEMFFNLLGKPAIVLIKDSNCGANMWYQVGTECVAANISGTFNTGTTKEGMKGYELTIANTATSVLLYEGDITHWGEIEGLVARLTGEFNDPIVTLDASTSTVTENTEYEYTVMYNDVNDNPQTIVLPETGPSAEFDTQILDNWNNAGFAIVLRIFNEFTEDTTRTGDITAEQPVIMGGFNEGFDGGFDFNISN